MANKYPGGYMIVDLGDLSKITADPGTTLKIDGIFDKISNSNKPVILTGAGHTMGAAGMDAPQLAISHCFMLHGEYTFGYLNYDENGATIALYGIAITSGDLLLDVSYEA